ncbi:Hypothetical predicted protein [Olea europaea subsp. europaea]|uniref:Uncharacterized protein n=1 Tax=Olea europaea subsp. europaea TaxID=158383 RepID=A0A8S0VGB8_OLEEU|nr:Hypothetical predicted protein [Olea europaea subsp. europaea]
MQAKQLATVDIQKQGFRLQRRLQRNRYSDKGSTSPASVDHLFGSRLSTKLRGSSGSPVSHTTCYPTKTGLSQELPMGCSHKRGTAEKSPQDYNYWEDRSLPQVGTSSDLETYLKREGKSRGVKLPDMNKYQRKEFMALYGIIVQQDLSLFNKKGLNKFVAKLKEERDSESRTRQALA